MATNNRFKKSIETATDNTQENIIDNTTETIKENVKTTRKTNTKTDIKDDVKENTTENIENDIKDNVLLEVSTDTLKIILEKDKKDKGSNHTIYLSSQVGDVLNKLVKKSKQSKSTLVNDILESVFKGNGLL